MTRIASQLKRLTKPWRPRCRYKIVSRHFDAQIMCYTLFINIMRYNFIPTPWPWWLGKPFQSACDSCHRCAIALNLLICEFEIISISKIDLWHRCTIASNLLICEFEIISISKIDSCHRCTIDSNLLVCEFHSIHSWVWFVSPLRNSIFP